jgi:proline racemase
VVTVALETGLVEMREPETRLVLDTPAGLVPVTAACRGWIFATHEFGCDPDDPFPEGFTLPDTWGPGISSGPTES